MKCKTTNLLIDPQGDIYRCHADLFNKNHEGVKGNIFDQALKLSPKYIYCNNFGFCNPCDVQIKFDRFGYWNYCVADVKGNDISVIKNSKIDWEKYD